MKKEKKSKQENSERELSIDVKIKFTPNSSSKCLAINLNEQLLKNNSQQENSKEKLSVDVNTQFILNSPNQCLGKIKNLNEMLFSSNAEPERWEKFKCWCC